MAENKKPQGTAPVRNSVKNAARKPAPKAPAPSRPGATKKPAAGRKKRGERRWLRRTIFGIAAFGALGFGLLVAAYFTTSIPEPDDFAQAQTTTVYFADGTEMGKFSEYNRESVVLADLPDHVAQALVASEDRRFYENPGVDLRGTMRALWNNIRGLPTQGGSTITQQYVERYYLGTTVTIPGKIKEAILALRINAETEKDVILENYLNTIYFGRGAYGIEVAAQNYFGKPAAELTLSESAMLMGIIPSPSRWDPAVDPAKAESRWNRVLDLMVEDGWITAAERDAQVFPTVIEHVPTDTYGGPTGYVLTAVRDELVEKAGITEAELDTAGLKIYTTIDPVMQQAALDAVATLPEGAAPNLRVGLVSMEPGTGAVKALYGGSDYLTQPRNSVTQDRAQMGSTAKIFGLISALDNGAQLGDRFASYNKMEIPGYDFPVSNYDTKDRGRINLVEATADSVNTVYVQMNVKYGPENTVDAMHAAGLPEDMPGIEAVPSNVLGSASARAWDTVRAYGTIAAEGVRADPYLVAEVQTSTGQSRYKAQQITEKVFDSELMAQTTYAMTQVTEGGTGVRAALDDRPTAGKTGSSNNYRSAWFAGFVPQLVTVVNMYQPGPNGEEEVITPFGRFAQISGGSYPAMIWHEYMSVATDGMEVQEFRQPARLNLPSETPTPTETTAPPTEAPTETTPPEDGAPVEPAPSPSPEPAPSPSPSPSP